ncbi:MAG TPA: trypsin-like peptidase domain-containing protein [Gemmatimonadaceae bacterium]|jgi:serine protease Do|nr:trypsin-like peptidase domain-containing protein [Gemmatimonadaceae bacterium]
MRSFALLSLLIVGAGCQGDTTQIANAAVVDQSTGAQLAASAPAGSHLAQRRTVITDAVSRIAPSVVTVQTEVVQHETDAFGQFFGARQQDRMVPGLGSGFVIRSDGVIVTNAHVVGGASSVQVALRDGTTYTAKILGSDEFSDLAVLKIPATGLPVAPLGSSDSLLIGEWAIAIGNPYGFYLGNPEPSVTAGVISAVGRNLVGQSEGNGTYVDMIQTDAAINPGNSGGPLVDALGEVIGVNSSIFTPSGGSIGLGFAIPINRAKRVAEDLLAHGSVRRPWIGIKLQLPEGDNPRDALRSGVIVRTVVPGSPAARAGLEPGDQIVRAGARTLHNPYDWEALLLDLRVGQSVPLVVRRDGHDQATAVTIADLPEVSAPKVEVLKELDLVSLTPSIRAEKGIRSDHGAVIYRVSNRVADELGIQAGDVIVQINRSPVGGADEAAKALNYYGGRGPIRMFFERNGQVFSTDFSIQ